MNENTLKFKQTNAFAMQYGLLLGLFAIAGVFMSVLSLQLPSLSFIGTLLTVGSPIFAGFLTTRFRSQVSTPEQGFSFARGFLFTLMLGLYASIWLSVFIYVYLVWFDHGHVFELYDQMLSRPEYQAVFQRNELLIGSGGVTPDKLVEDLRSIPPVVYAYTVISITIFSAPAISAVIALVCRRTPKFF